MWPMTAQPAMCYEHRSITLVRYKKRAVGQRQVGPIRNVLLVDSLGEVVPLGDRLRLGVGHRGERQLGPPRAPLEAALATGHPSLRRFANGLRKDFDAVTAGLTLHHSSGAVEGNVNRLKMIKRKLYGRANLDFIRKLVILST